MEIASFLSADQRVFLSDSEGYIVSVTGECRLSQVCGVILEVGALWSEAQQGTNAIGLVLNEKKPCQVIGVEHYFKAYHGLAGAAAPILSPEGACYGILGVVGSKDVSHPHTLGMVAAARSSNQPTRVGAHNRTAHSVVQAMSDGLIAIDNDGIITHMNHVAGRIFGLKPMACGRRAGKYLGITPLLQAIKTGRKVSMIENLL